jgi:hypothetical protein
MKLRCPVPGWNFTAWKKFHARLSLTRDEFNAYLDGSLRAHLLLLHQVCILNEPLHLHQLRQNGQFQPPQSFRYVTPSDPTPLHDLPHAAGRRVSSGQPRPGMGDPWVIDGSGTG